MPVLLGALTYLFWGYVLWCAWPTMRSHLARVVAARPRLAQRGRYSARGGDL